MNALVTLVTLVPLGLVALEGAGRADSMFATDHGGTLVVSQLAGDTLTNVYEEPDSGVIKYGWSDAHTLWVLRAQKGVFSIEKIVDGKPQTARVLMHADWKSAPGRPATRVPQLSITKSGTVWLRRCVAIVHDEKTNRDACPERYLRVDADAEVADHPPDGIRSDEELPIPQGVSDGPQRVPGPKGYMFAVTKSGFTCTAPKHRLVFPAGTRWIESPFWVTSDPAIVHFGVGKFDSYEQGGANDGTGDFLLEDCTTYLTGVKTVEPGVVATTEGKSAWKLRRGATVLGTFTAAHVEVAP